MAEPTGLIGIRATIGPLDATTMPLRPGLTALYGLNGAGKSTLLDSLRIVFTGAWGAEQGDRDAALFFQDDEHHSALRGLYETEVLRLTNPRRYGYADSGFRFFPTADVGDAVAGELVSIWAEHLPDADAYAAFAAEVAEGGVLAYVPVGSTEPRWEVWACTSASPDAVQLKALVARFAEERDRLRALSDSIRGHSDEEVQRRSDAYWDEAHRVGSIAHLLGAKTLGFDPGFALEEAMHYIDQTLDRDAHVETLLGFDGMPSPVARLGTVGTIPWSVAAPSTLALAEEATLRHAAERPEGLRAPSTWNLQPWQASLEAWAKQLQDSANDVFRRVLLDAPTLELLLFDPWAWFSHHICRWRAASGGPNLRPVGLDRLSQAEQKWAAFAIVQAAIEPRPAVWLLDEPEAALHRSAEEHMAHGLAWLSRPDEYVIAATHSPPLLDDPRTHVLRVDRESGTTRVTELQRSDWRSLTTLGMSPSDLLRRWRVVLLVEGHHEEVIFATALGEQLHRARVHVLPIGGVGQLHATVDSRLLWDFTDAEIIPVVDNESADRLDLIWNHALVLAAGPGGTQVAIDYIGRELPGRQGTETKAMREFLSLAIAKGRPTYSRIRPFAFRKPDITDYLPLKVLLPEVPNATWDGLRAEQAKQTAPGQQAGAFKPWLEKRYGKKHGRTIFTDESVAKAARAMAAPEEFERLIRFCEQAGPPPQIDATGSTGDA